MLGFFVVQNSNRSISSPIWTLRLSNQETALYVHRMKTCIQKDVVEHKNIALSGGEINMTKYFVISLKGLRM